MGLNHRTFAESAYFSVEGNKISDVKLDLSSINMRDLESLGFKCEEKQIGEDYFYNITIPETFTINDIGTSKYNDYFGSNYRGSYRGRGSSIISDYIIKDKKGDLFCILAGKLTKSIEEIEEDIEARKLEMARQEKERNIKKHQKQVRESMFSTLQLGSYRSDNIKFGEKDFGGFLPACFIPEHKEGDIKRIETLGCNVEKNEEYPDLYDIKIPKKFSLRESDYHLDILGENGETIITFYYKRDFGKIINLDFREAFDEIDLEKIQEENDIHIISGGAKIVIYIKGRSSLPKYDGTDEYYLPTNRRGDYKYYTGEISNNGQLKELREYGDYEMALRNI